MRRFPKKALTLVLVVISVIIATAILLDYNIFVFKRAVKDIPLKYKMMLVKYFPFSEENSLREWEEKIFKGKVVYRIEKNGKLSYVRATSDQAASALYYRIKVDSRTKFPLLKWKWRAEKFPSKQLPENLEAENEDDFAARVYVIFPAAFFTNSKVLEYIWADNLPVGTTGTSPYSKNIKLMVLRSGPAKDNEWFAEERDIVSDYLKMFARRPEYNIGAVAFMTNTEHTKTSADAVYDDIELGYKVDSAGKGGSDEDKVPENEISNK